MKIILTILFSLLLLGCQDANSPDKKVKNKPHNPKEIVVVTHNGPNTYFINGDNKLAGLEFDLATLFVKDLGEDYSLKFLVVDNISQVIPSLLKGKADIAAADLSITHLRQHLVTFSTPYHQTQQEIVFNNELRKKPKQLKELIGASLAVPAGTSYAERLSIESQSMPLLSWREVKHAGTDELMEQVAYGLIDYTVADKHIVALLQNFYPNLETAFAIGKPEEIAWAFPKNRRPELIAKANVFIQRIKKDGTLRNLIDRYYGNAERLNNMDVTTFLKRLKTTLPQYKSTFIEAQEITGIDWRLIAAVSYRESHWDRLNTSPTGVRGMMMLTEDTADMLGVTDRLDARQSILGGARYMVQLIDTIPARIPEPDRTWMALAAYNIGYAHLEDARVLAQRMKLNPDSWADVKKMLPLLNKYDYYSTLKYGYASGGAPVVFVESIRTYHKILERFERAYPNKILDFNIAEAETSTAMN